MKLPRFLQFPGYIVKDFKEFLSDGRVEVHLELKGGRKRLCCRCRGPLEGYAGQHPMRLEGLPISGFRQLIFFWRAKGFCGRCGKNRSEHISFLSELSPHYTKDYAWWLGKFCEFAPVSRVAGFNNQSKMTLWRLDFARMQMMLQLYKIPPVRRISVDEVYAQNKKKTGQSRDDQFFTVITDLATRRVIWVTDSRRKEALDRFFEIIGPEACARIEIVACDQHDAYAASVKEYCPYATLVWDRFHIMQVFEIALNETRKDLHQQLWRDSDVKRLSAGRFRYIFLKKAERRTKTEAAHMSEVLQDNRAFAALEIIKERMFTFFDQKDEWEAEKVFNEVGSWIDDMKFTTLQRWHTNLKRNWDTLKNYFRHRVTSAVSEGHNNVIKMLKRRAFGFRNMEYFKLKIMQVCGYLNSKYINSLDSLTLQP